MRFADFLSARQCAELVGEIGAADQEQVQVHVWRDDRFAVDPHSRRGVIARPSPATEDLVQDRLWGVVPALGRRPGCDVSFVSGATALIYDEGDHFAAHSDGGGDDSAPREVRRRPCRSSSR